MVLGLFAYGLHYYGKIEIKKEQNQIMENIDTQFSRYKTLDEKEVPLVAVIQQDVLNKCIVILFLH